MNSNEVREKFLKFFESKGHKILPSSSLIPEELAGTQNSLFTMAGMQQFKSYYGAPDNAIKDFGTTNITTSQRCVRTGDIDEVGDSTHLTFFEMLGNFSFSGYWKKEAIEYAHEFITKELNLPISYVTIFKGNGSVKKDDESRDIWKSLGITDIREEGMEDVFWGPTGGSGPCGPTTEIYCKNANGEDVEVWNIVFNQYYSNVSYEELVKGPSGEGFLIERPELRGIDTGMGFERLLATVQNVKSVYDTDLFTEVFTKINELSKSNDEKAKRIVTDHVRTATFMIADGVVPSNTDRGYILRRLLRRAVRFADTAGLPSGSLETISSVFIEKYKDSYSSILQKTKIVLLEIKKEEGKFRETFPRGIKALQYICAGEDIDSGNINALKINDELRSKNRISGRHLFKVFSTYGFPLEMSLEFLKEQKQNEFTVFNEEEVTKEFYKEMQEHQKLSQTSSAGMFKGGLANHNEQTIRLHTAHHLLLAALQQVLGKEVKQRGSNITEERLRMDFAFDRKMTDEEKAKVEEIVNDYITRGLNVVRREMPLVEAEKLGAEMEFGAKYPETVSLYFVEDEKGDAISKEFCGGPHVANTKELGVFKIQKEEASSAGVRRIKAVLG